MNPTLTIRRYPDPILSKCCAPFPVEHLADPVTGDAWRSYWRSALEMLPKVGAYALAANQLGHSLRWIVIGGHRDLRVPPMGMVIVNPVLSWLDGPQVSMPEGCMSLPGIRVDVKRPKMCTMSWVDGMTGATRENFYDGLMARVLQHEIDHLDGTLSIDRATTVERTRVAPALQAMNQTA